MEAERLLNMFFRTLAFLGCLLISGAALAQTGQVEPTHSPLEWHNVVVSLTTPAA